MRVIPLFCRVSYDGQSFLLMLQVSFPLQLVLTKYCAILKSAEIKAVIEEKAFFWKFSAWIFDFPPTDWLMWRLRINLQILVIAPDCEKSSHKKRKKNGSSSVLCERNNRAGEVMEGGMESGDHTSFFFLFSKNGTTAHRQFCCSESTYQRYWNLPARILLSLHVLSSSPHKCREVAPDHGVPNHHRETSSS